MKSAFLALTVSLLSLTASAQPNGPRIEPGPIVKLENAAGITEVLLANPDLVKELHDAGTTEVKSVTFQNFRPGNVQYRIIATTCGMCLPKTATVTIFEDSTPNSRDAPTVYRVSVSYDNHR